MMAGEKGEDVKPVLGVSMQTYPIMLTPDIFCVAIKGLESKPCIGWRGGLLGPAGKLDLLLAVGRIQFMSREGV